MPDAVILDALRTPIGRYAGVLSSARPDDLDEPLVGEQGGDRSHFAVATDQFSRDRRQVSGRSDRPEASGRGGGDAECRVVDEDLVLELL